MRRLAPPLVALALVSSTSIARGDGTADARALYDQGAAAYDAADYARAASLLGDADAMSPNPMVLELAIQASTKAGDAVLADDLALRADARSPTGDLANAAAQAHERFHPKVGRVRIVCDAHAPCAARIGSMRWVGGERHAVAPGVVDVVFDGSSKHVRIEVTAGTEVNLLQPMPAQPAPMAFDPPIGTVSHGAPSAGEGPGLSPWVFWAGVALTATLTGAAGASAVDTRSRHDDFVANRTLDDQRAGESAQLRTNVLLVGAIASAVAATAVGVFFTRWRTPTGIALTQGLFW